MPLIVKTALPLVLYAAFASGFILRQSPATQIWFVLAGASLVFYAVLARMKRDGIYIRSALFLSGIIVAGAAEASGARWLHMAYIPYIVFVAAFFPAGTLLFTLAFVPLFEIRHFLIEGALLEELSLSAAVALTGGASFFFLGRARREKDRLSASLRSLKNAAMETLSVESYIERGVSLSMEADGEIDEALSAVRLTLGTDSASLFVPQAGELSLRRTTVPGGEAGGLSLMDKGLVHIVFSRKEAIAINNADMKRYNPGYERKGRIVSMAAVPVMDEGFCMGVLASDSGTAGAFGDREVSALRSFARLIAGILKKQRIYAEMERSQLGLRLLHEGSARLVGSLKLDAITGEFVEGVKRIVPSKEGEFGIALFLNNGEGFELVKDIGLPARKKKIFGLRNTLLEMAVRGNDHIYIPDLRGYTLPVLPFYAGKPSSAFLLPLFYEKETIGILAAVSSIPDPLTAHQIEIIDVFGNQASTSLKNAMLHANIERMATTDGLTGLFNHRQFQERLASEIKRQARYGTPLSLLLIDLDFFKKVNDTYGHPAGDAVLRASAGILRNAVREVDMPARYGGEEFAALLIDTDKNGALQTAERLRASIEAHDFQANGKKISVTASIGVSSAPLDARAKEELIDRADKSLYHAKAGGRNMVVGWSDELLDLHTKKESKR